MRLGAASIIRLEVTEDSHITRHHWEPGGRGVPARSRSAQLAFESVHVTRIIEQRSNQRHPQQPDVSRSQPCGSKCAFADVAPAGALGCGQRLCRSGTGGVVSHTAVPAASGHARSWRAQPGIRLVTLYVGGAR